MKRSACARLKEDYANDTTHKVLEGKNGFVVVSKTRPHVIEVVNNQGKGVVKVLRADKNLAMSHTVLDWNAEDAKTYKRIASRIAGMIEKLEEVKSW